MRLLELFAGTGSVKKAVGHLFTEVVSIDILPTYAPSEVSDILSWDYTQYPPGYFHTIWASPPCTEYSSLKSISGAVRNLALADSIVERTISIIQYFDPERFFIENPQTGMLKERPFMLGIPFVDVDYCMFSDWGYRKRTRIWTNVAFTDTLCNKACGNLIGRLHRMSCCQGRSRGESNAHSSTKHEMWRIPPRLLVELFAAPF